MTALQQATTDFLDGRRIAIVGVSRNPQEAANAIYRKFRDAGYEVYAVNPKADTVEGDPCYPDLGAVPDQLDGVVAVTPPEATEGVARACVDLGIPRLWMHRGMGAGSVSEDAAEVCRAHGIAVIPGACPMMYLEPVDFAHRCFRGLSRLTGRLPVASSARRGAPAAKESYLRRGPCSVVAASWRGGGEGRS